jgi:hypothetical protein
LAAPAIAAQDFIAKSRYFNFIHDCVKMNVPCSNVSVERDKNQTQENSHKIYLLSKDKTDSNKLVAIIEYQSSRYH